MDGAVIKSVNYTSSCVAYNNGKGHFTVKKLPMAMQLSSVNAILVIDINNDGYKDIIAAGNFFDLLPQFCRVDASYGHVLINDKKGNFVEMPAAKTGISLSGQIRDIISFTYKNEPNLLFLENNDFPVMYRLISKTKTTK